MLIVSLLSLIATGRAAAQSNGVTTGELIIDPPTLINLGFEWLIDGDDNRNATVEVSYRKQGDGPWKRALPLLRLQGERIYNGALLDVVSPNMFAGSILDLEHSVLVDYDVFVNVPKLDAQDTRTVQKVYKAEDFDFRLKPASAAVDRGVVLPNVNEGFNGTAPDLGALELGRPLPHVGPRK